MRYIHARKTPQIPMYNWLEYRNRQHEIYELNRAEQIAIYWYGRHKELQEMYFATPMKVYWESFKEKFPDMRVDYIEIKDDILELITENARLKVENELLKDANQWIPCSERQPKISYWYQTVKLDEATNELFECEDHFLTTTETWYKSDHKTLFWRDNIPLPPSQIEVR